MAFMKSEEEIIEIIEAVKSNNDIADIDSLKVLEPLLNDINQDSYYLPILIATIAQKYEDIGAHDKVIKYSNMIINSHIKYDDNYSKFKMLSLALLKKATSCHLIGKLQESVDSYNDIIQISKRYPNFLNDYDLMAAYQGIGYIQAALGQYEQIEKDKIKLLRMARSNMKKAIQIKPDFFPLYAQLAVIYNHLGDIDKAESAYIKSLLTPMRIDINQTKFNRVLYKYMPIDKYSMINLINNTLFLNDPKKFNDPFDCPIFRGNNYKNYKSFSNVMDRIRISCFSEKFDSILMWSHYADSHMGICVGYRLDSGYCLKNNLHSGFVDYQEGNQYNKGIKNFKGLLNDTFYIKNKEWEYESEFRIIGYELESDIIQSPEIVEIIFGINTTSTDRNLIKNVFKDKKNIIFKEVIDNKDDNINLSVELMEKVL